MSTAARGEFSRLPGGRPARAKLELTGGMKALVGLDTIFLLITMGCAITTLVLVALLYSDNCCDKVKSELHDIKRHCFDKSSSSEDCAMLGESCQRTRDCCKNTGSELVCSSGTCQAIVTGSNSERHKT